MRKRPAFFRGARELLRKRIKLETELKRVPYKSKSSVLAQLIQVEKSSGKTPPQLKEYRECKVPEHFQYIMDYFYDCYTGERYTHTEMLNWMEIKRIRLAAWEVDCLRVMWSEKDASDAAYQQRVIESTRTGKGKK